VESRFEDCSLNSCLKDEWLLHLQVSIKVCRTSKINSYRTWNGANRKISFWEIELHPVITLIYLADFLKRIGTRSFFVFLLPVLCIPTFITHDRKCYANLGTLSTKTSL